MIFGEMKDLSNVYFKAGSRDDLLKNMSHYQRKMVKLARNHDLQQTQKVIAKHLAKIR